MWSWARAVSSIAVATVLPSIIHSLQSVGSETVTGYAAVTPPDGEFPWRAVRLFLLSEKHCFEEKTMMPGGGGWRDCVSGFVYTPGMTFGEGCTRSSGAASNGEDCSLISWISFPGWERGAPVSQDVLLR